MRTRQKCRQAPRLVIGVSAVAAGLLLGAGCTSGTPGGTTSASAVPGSTAAASGSAAPRSAPAVVETNPPGDIPDNQAYVRYAGSGYTVLIPEGWAQTSPSGATVFSDKYNSVSITTGSAAQAPTVASARSVDVPAVKAAAAGFVAGTVSSVTRTAGAAVLITYRAFSPVNPVTGKVADEAVERYEFWKSGHTVTLTLAAPVGSDNVDPWRKVTDSFAWTTS